MADAPRWVMDTSTYTHLCRAGHADLIEQLAPGGIVVVPSEVATEIEAGRQHHSGIHSVSEVGWAEIAVLTEEEIWTELEIKAQMGGNAHQHLGECAVISCAHHRGLIAILDDRAAMAQADRLGVKTHDTLWIVIEAYKVLFDRDRAITAKVVDDLLDTGMYLPLGSGESIVTWAWEEGLLP
jgi:predicted nucleic acid-binding protein